MSSQPNCCSGYRNGRGRCLHRRTYLPHRPSDAAKPLRVTDRPDPDRELTVVLESELYKRPETITVPDEDFPQAAARLRAENAKA